MKQKATNGRLILAAAFLCALPLLTGCMPYPHRTLRSSEVSGTVLDARTHAPIGGAKVVQSEDTAWGPGVKPSGIRRKTVTDPSGGFLLPITHQFHWARSVDGDVPQQRYYEVVRISHPGYLGYEVKGPIYWDKLNVLLQPLQSLEIQGRVLDSQTMAPIEGARIRLIDGGLECKSDRAGHFRLATTPAFYKASRASEASGWPFRDNVFVDRGSDSVTFHSGDNGDVRRGNTLVQLGE